MIGARVLYVPPAGDPRPARLGAIVAISGASACVQFDDCPWPQWAPLERLYGMTEDWGGVVAVGLGRRPVITNSGNWR